MWELEAKVPTVTRTKGVRAGEEDLAGIEERRPSSISYRALPGASCEFRFAAANQTYHDSLNVSIFLASKTDSPSQCISSLESGLRNIHMEVRHSELLRSSSVGLLSFTLRLLFISSNVKIM